MYQNFYDKMVMAAGEIGERAAVASHYLILHKAAAINPNGTYLELGTGSGRATKIILNALAGGKGRLCSVDIRDCSSAASGNNWVFIQSDSTDIEKITHHASFLKNGIDFVFIDSLHKANHVLKEVMSWYGFLKKNGKMFFHDVDSGPYMKGRRKDNAGIEIANREIHQLIHHIYYNNIDQTRLVVHYGGPGLAELTKLSELSVQLRINAPSAKRRSKLYHRMRRCILRDPAGQDLSLPVD